MTENAIDTAIDTQIKDAIVNHNESINDSDTIISTLPRPEQKKHLNPANTRRLYIDRFVEEYVKAKRENEVVSNTQIALRAGYTEKSAPFRASKLLKDPRVQKAIDQFLAKIRIKEEFISTWTLEKSIETAENMFKKLSANKDAASQNVAFKYKENLDKLNKLLVDRQEIVERVKYKEIDALGDEELKQLAGMRIN